MRSDTAKRGLILMVVLAFLIAACGGGAGNDTTSTTARSTSTSTPGGGQSTTSTVADAWAQIEEAAREEGQLILYTATHDGINLAEIEGFNEVYPEIEVLHTRLVSGELTSRFASETEAGAPSADLIKIADNVMLEGRPEWFVELTAENVPNLATIGEQNHAGHYIHMMVAPFVITTNTDLVPEPPTQWAQLIEEPYVGINGMLVDPRSSGSFMAGFAQLRDWFGDEFLESLRDAGYEWYTSSATAVQEVAAGAYAFNAFGQPAHSKELRDAGAPLAATLLEPSIAFTHILAVAKNAVNPNAALVYANWLLTREGQEAACQGEYYSVLDVEVPNCPPSPAEVTFIDAVKAAAESDEINQLLGLE